MAMHNSGTGGASDLPDREAVYRDPIEVCTTSSFGMLAAHHRGIRVPQTGSGPAETTRRTSSFIIWWHNLFDMWSEISGANPDRYRSLLLGVILFGGAIVTHSRYWTSVPDNPAI